MIRAALLVAFSLFGFSVWQGEPSKQVRAKLFQQVLADDADFRDCLKEQEDGAAVAQENMTIEELDLNRDGVKEYEVQLPGMCGCGAQNCAIYIYRPAGQRFERILEGIYGLGIELRGTSSNGYRDLQINSHDTAATEARTVYKFDGQQYREATTTIVNLETGESKPAWRRVQFKRGSSSATVQGKVSIALPDQYLVGARAGQVMSVQLTSPQKSVRFLVMGPRASNLQIDTPLLADNARSWSGTLQTTGDYHILVEGDERGGTYSLTISIK